MGQGVTVVTYDSDAPGCRSLFINQATPDAIGASEVDLLASEINSTGQIAIVSAASTATNQNAWIGFMKQELAAKYPNMTLVATVYGNDDPTTSTQVTQGLLAQYPNLKGIISPTTVGIAAAAAVLDTTQYRGKVQLVGLGTPNSMKQYVNDGTVTAFELWNPADLGYPNHRMHAEYLVNHTEVVNNIDRIPRHSGFSIMLIPLRFVGATGSPVRIFALWEA